MKETQTDVVVNARILKSHLTGVQRYLLSILEHIPVDMDKITPTAVAGGVKGHLWEQSILPAKVGKKLLWSPSNTGPLATCNQVVTIHDVVPLDHPEWLNKRFASWYRFLTPRLMPRVKRIIAISEFTRSRILAHTNVLPENIVVIPNGVDDRFSPSSSELIEKTIDALGLPSRRYVLSVGSLEPRKNIGRLLQAWSMLLPNLPSDLWLVLAGAKGKQLVFQGLGANFEELPPRVYLTGHVPEENLVPLYSGAEVFCYPSIHEGFGLPPLEALACGVPTVTSNTTAIPEVVADAAMLINPLDVEDIARGILAVINNDFLKRKLSNRGLERAQQFSWKRSAASTWEILQESAVTATPNSR